jgi:hypothetical protein
MRDADVSVEHEATPAAAVVADVFRRSLAGARTETKPFRHWLLSGCLPAEACETIAALPVPPPAYADTLGKRETYNESRVFFGQANQARFPVCRAVSEALQSELAVRAIEQTCAIRLAGSSLRIEYCQDTQGFWLEPHTDIKPKLFTMQIFVSRAPGADALGTTVYDSEKRPVGRLPAGFNRGYMFVPADDTWHGFEPRSFAGVRRSIIVNYVTPEWRARHELSFPERPVA